MPIRGQDIRFRYRPLTGGLLFCEGRYTVNVKDCCRTVLKAGLWGVHNGACLAHDSSWGRDRIMPG